MADSSSSTSFTTIYDRFLGMITSEMYMEFTECDTYEQLQELLINAIPRFRFPRFDVYDYEAGDWDYIGTYCGVDSQNIEVDLFGWSGGYFNAELSEEEINILSTLMVVEWLGQQLANTELVQEKYSGTDFKFTSQANHMAKLKNLVEFYETDAYTKQDVYKRRKRSKAGMLSTLGKIMEVPSYGYKI